MFQPAALTTVANIHAWFTDCATRHPLVRHSDANKRLYLLEWDEILALPAPMAMPEWSIVLMVRSERPRDNGGDYASTLSVISFTVLKHVPRNKAISQKKAMWDEARTIAMGIVGKMKADERERCQPDLPAGVIPPRLVDLNSLQMQEVEPPYADHAVGIRTLITWRTDIPDPVPFRCNGEGYGSFTVAAGGAAAPGLTTSTGHYAYYDAAGNVVVDSALEAGGSYCLYASDASGNMTGEVTELFLFYGELAGMVIDGFTALRVIYMEYWVIPSLPSLANQPLLEMVHFMYPPPDDTLPDFHSGAVLNSFYFGPQVGVPDTFPLANVGVLPTFNGTLQFINCALTQTAVDAIINHCDPSVPGYCAIIGGTSAPRSSASDTNYYACISGGWTFNLNP